MRDKYCQERGGASPRYCQKQHLKPAVHRTLRPHQGVVGQGLCHALRGGLRLLLRWHQPQGVARGLDAALSVVGLLEGRPCSHPRSHEHLCVLQW